MRQMTTDFRDPIIWLLLTVVGGGIAEIVVFWLLDDDLVKHDQAEVGVEYDLALIYSRLGQSLPYPDAARVKGKHNYIGRIVASIFSVGIYTFWWVHNLMEEPNEHFRTNWTQEDALAAAVQAL
jgi:hypothetical protein